MIPRNGGRRASGSVYAEDWNAESTVRWSRYAEATTKKSVHVIIPQSDSGPLGQRPR